MAHQHDKRSYRRAGVQSLGEGLMACGKDDDTQVPISFESIHYRPYVTYSRNQELWRVEMGFVDMSMDLFYKFQFGRSFVFFYPDNTVCRMIVYQNGDRMKWVFQPLNLDTSIPLREEDVIHLNSKVEDGKLIMKTEYPSKITIIKTYIRDDGTSV